MEIAGSASAASGRQRVSSNTLGHLPAAGHQFSLIVPDTLIGEVQFRAAPAPAENAWLVSARYRIVMGSREQWETQDTHTVTKVGDNKFRLDDSLHGFTSVG